MIQEYIRAQSKDEVVDLVHKGYSILAGGTFLSKNQDHVTGLVDIQELGLDTICTNSDEMLIGACTSFTKIIESSLIWQSFKEVIAQELKVNQRNAATLAGYALVSGGFSNILGWLTCADAYFHFYPETSFPAKRIGENLPVSTRKALVEIISIPLAANVVWEMVSRTPDDFPLIGVFYNCSEGQKRVALTGFGDRVLTFQFQSDSDMSKEFQEHLNTSRSQFNNQYISYNYYVKNSCTLFQRLLLRDQA
jgi:CO/xanthine dehydrogenase FAD-binding subunit